MSLKKLKRSDPRYSADYLRTLSRHDREAFTWRLGAENLDFIEKDWLFWARDSQLPPEQWGSDGCFIWNIRAGRGFGKALDLNTVIPTASGWTTMNRIKIGETVFDENGKQCTVTFVSNIMLNHKCYDVVFSDGSVIKADAEHEWLTTVDTGFSALKITKTIKETLSQKHKIICPENKEVFILAINDCESVPVRCIQVDSDSHLYLAGKSMIPTHNTRCGAETFIYAIKEGGYTHPNLAGATSEDVRDLMIEGESGILACAPEDFYPEFVPTLKKLIWPNGVVTHIYYGTEPDKARGPQSDFIWADEIAKWQYPEETFDNLLMGLRLGPDPRCMITSTPRPTKFLMDLEKRKDPLGRPSCVVTRGNTKDNYANLSDIFISTIISKYEGTRLGRQELDGEFLDDNPNALWRRSDIDNSRVSAMPELSQIVIAVDPAGKSEKTSDDTGIIAAGKGHNGHGYVLEDCTLHGTPAEWATAAISAYHKYKANWVVAETNFGGEMVEYTISTVDSQIPYKPVHASRGKEIRAEPVSSLYQQGRVHHVGFLGDLETEMCLAGNTLIKTEFGDMRLDEVYPGLKVYTRGGLKPIIWAGKTGISQTVYEISTSQNKHLLATNSHLIYVEGIGYTKVSELCSGDVLLTWQKAKKESHMMESGITSTSMDIMKTKKWDFCTESCGKNSMGKYQKEFTYTTLTKIGKTIISTISKQLQCLNTNLYTLADLVSGTQNSTASTLNVCGINENLYKKYALPVEQNSILLGCEQCTAAHSVEEDTIISVQKKKQKMDVYNIKVADIPEYYANDILVHNCEWIPNSGMKSPNRVDALVWCISALNLPTGNARIPTGIAQGLSSNQSAQDDFDGF